MSEKTIHPDLTGTAAHSDALGFPHIPTPKEIAEELADMGGFVEKVAGDISTSAVASDVASIDSFTEKVTESVSDILKKALTEILTPPVIPELGTLASLDGVKTFIGQVDKTLHLDDLTTLLTAIPAKSETSAKSVTGFFSAIDTFVVQLKAVITSEEIKGMEGSLSQLEAMRSGLSTFMENLGDEALKLVQFPTGFPGLDGLTDRINDAAKQLESALSATADYRAEMDAGPNMTADALKPDYLGGTLIVVKNVFTEVADMMDFIGNSFPGGANIGAAGGVAAGINGTLKGGIQAFRLGIFTFGGFAFISKTIAQIVGTVYDIYQLEKIEEPTSEAA